MVFLSSLPEAPETAHAHVEIDLCASSPERRAIAWKSTIPCFPRVMLPVSARLPNRHNDSPGKGGTPMSRPNSRDPGKHPTDDVYEAWLQACHCSEELRANLDEQLELARNHEVVVPAFAEPWLDAEGVADFTTSGHWT
jgi:hypothetical protein